MSIQTYTYGAVPVEMWEYPMILILLLAVFIVGGIIKRQGLRKRIEYKYFLFGLWAKIFGGIAFACIYIFYYGQGDTTSYFESALAFQKLFLQDPMAFFEVYFGSGSHEIKSFFTAETGEPLWFMFSNDNTRFVMKLITPFIIITNGSYFLSTILVSIVTYGGLWRLYLMFSSYFPEHYRNLAIACLFMPSVIFWGSGLMKDSFTLAATCYFIVVTNNIIQKRGFIFFNVLRLIFWATLILYIKAYVLVILLPGTMIWFYYDRIIRIRNKLLRALVVPVVYGIVITGSYLILNSLEESLGKFSIKNAAETASATQHDLKQEYYQGNSFDIGEIDPSMRGILTKLPRATLAGLYRPYLWESKNIVMLISGIENMFMLGATILVLAGLKRKVLTHLVTSHPLIFYALIFSVLFAFMIGLSTSNFGALVRFRIPIIPLYMSAILVMLGYMKQPKVKTQDKRLIVGIR